MTSLMGQHEYGMDMREKLLLYYDRNNENQPNYEKSNEPKSRYDAKSHDEEPNMRQP